MIKAKATPQYDTREYGGVKLHTVPLEPMDALDLAPEIVEIIGPSGAAAVAGSAAVGEVAGMVGRALAGGRLTALLPRLLAGTTMVVPGVGKFELASREVINRALTARPEMLIPAVLTALEVHFKRFFPGFALVGLKAPMEFDSEDSSPSTNDTGPSIG